VSGWVDGEGGKEGGREERNERWTAPEERRRIALGITTTHTTFSLSTTLSSPLRPSLPPSLPPSLSRYGNQAWTQALPWAGQEAFLAAEDTPWTLEDGTEAGMVRTAEGFTFLRVYGA
jgi:hypothetical protein